MSYICDNCKKSSTVGRQHLHGKGVAANRWRKRVAHTKKVFKPNLHSATVVINGLKKKMLLCTSCLKSLKKQTQLISK